MNVYAHQHLKDLIVKPIYTVIQIHAKMEEHAKKIIYNQRDSHVNVLNNLLGPCVHKQYQLVPPTRVIMKAHALTQKAVTHAHVLLKFLALIVKIETTVFLVIHVQVEVHVYLNPHHQ